jgi:hypothetical protein
MKRIKSNIYKLFIAIAVSTFVIGCDINEEPMDGVENKLVFMTAEGIDAALMGVYGYFHYQDPEGTFGAYDFYMRLHHFVGEYAGDNIVVSGTTADPLFNIYTYNHNVDNGSVKAFYQSSYKMILAINRLIENIELENEDDPRAHMLGECYFLRGFVYFNMVNAFGRPYQQSPETNLGVSLKLDTDDQNLPARATVKEVYDAIEADYLKATELLGFRDDKLESKWHNIRASKEVAWAALSRFYLYKDEDKKAADFADSVLTSETYSLITDSASYVKYPKVVPELNKETIFAIRQTEDDKLGWAAIGAMYYKEGGNGWGETYASEPFRDLLGENPQDWRHGFIEPQYNAAGKIDNRNGILKYYINKCSFQEDNHLVYSPIIFRLAEMYLNRAEARAKTGDLSGAIADVNVIRQRVNTPVYTSSDYTDQESVLDLVLQERRLELAFEAHRKFDLFRNNKTLTRDYDGAHEESGINVVPPDHPRVVLLLPEIELIAQPNLIQNP